MLNTDVIIVGAGLAGLYASLRLTQRNIPHIVLEAKNEAGGRIKALKADEESSESYDLGPTWVFPHQQKLQQLTQELNLELFNQYIEGDALFQRAGSHAPERFSGAGAMELFRIKNGTYSLIEALVQRLPDGQLKLNHAVRSIEREEGSWSLKVNNDGEQKDFKTKHLLLALPPRMVAQHLIPQNWASKTLLKQLNASQTWMSAQAKFIATYDKPFWREQGLSGQAFSQVGPMIEMHDASVTETNNHALFGFIGLPAQQRNHYSLTQLKNSCLEQLAWFYGDVVHQYQRCEVMDWAKDPWVASERDINEPSKHPTFHTASFEQELDSLNLYLAGSEFATSDPGYLEGAVDAVDLSLLRLFPVIGQ